MNNERIKTWFGWLRQIRRDENIPYMDRYSLRKQFESGQNAWRVYVQRFWSRDSEGFHSHPWRWSFSIVLFGSYTEEVLTVQEHPLGWPPISIIRERRVRWLNWIPADKYHTITELHPGIFGKSVGNWTIFFAGPLTGKGWGFMTERGHVPWQEYGATQR